MFDHETSDLEDLESFDHESMGVMDGEEEFDGEAEGDPFIGDIVGGLLGESDTEDLEGDQFIGKLIRRGVRQVGRVAQQAGVGAPLLKHLAKQAATVAGGAIAGRSGANLAGQIANQILREGDFEDESDGEGDFEALGGDPEIVEEMNYHAAMAAESDNEDEADQFIGAIANLAGPLLKNVFGGLLGGGDDGEGDPFLGGLLGENDLEDLEGYDHERDEFLPLLAPLLAKAVPMVAQVASPLINRGIRAVGKMMRGRRATRPAIRALPRIAANTAASLARQARRGRRITPRSVATTMAQQTTRALATPRKLGRAVQQNRVAAARAQARPAGIVPRPGAARPGYARPGYAPRQRRAIVGYIPVYASRRVR
jgi:hypothetical protein